MFSIPHVHVGIYVLWLSVDQQQVCCICFFDLYFKYSHLMLYCVVWCVFIAGGLGTKNLETSD